MLFDDFAAELARNGNLEVWGIIRHAVDGTRDLHDLVGVHITRVSQLKDP